MKKLGFTLLLFSIVLTSLGQDYQKFRFGFRANPSVGWMTPQNNQITADGAVFRFGYGVVTDFHFTENYALGTGINIDTYGGKLIYVDEVEETDNPPAEFLVTRTRNYNLQYLEIPLTLKLRTNEVGYITYWGQFGLGLGVNIKGRADDDLDFRFAYDPNKVIEKDTIGGWIPSEDPAQSIEKINLQDEDDQANLFRTSLIIAAGIEYNLSGSTSILIGVTYNNGFTNALDGQGVSTNDNGDPEIKSVGSEVGRYKLNANTNSVALNIGIMF